VKHGTDVPRFTYLGAFSSKKLTLSTKPRVISLAGFEAVAR
jgi:hypothetical protein